MQKSAILQQEQAVSELRQQLEEDKLLAIEEATMETKKHVWVRTYRPCMYVVIVGQFWHCVISQNSFTVDK